MCGIVKFFFFLINFVIFCDAHLFTKYTESILHDEQFLNTFHLIEPESLIKNYQNIKENGFKACARDLDLLQQSLIKRKTWALKMLDASSKIPSGLFEGNIIELGTYDECIDINDKSSEIDIRAHHCMYSLNVQKGNAILPVNPSLSICLPETCTSKDIASLINNTLNKNARQKEFDVGLNRTYCSLNQKEFWDTRSIIFTIIIAVFVGFLIFCTICDLVINNFYHVNENNFGTLTTLTEFSLWKSAMNILKLESKDDAFPILHGIKFFSAVWVILSHEWFSRIMAVNANFLFLLNQMESWMALVPFSGQYSVDTFFTVSGFLMTYLFLLRMTEHKKINVLSLYIHRYLRITPAILVVVFGAIFFGPKLGSGPRWDILAHDYVTVPCEKKWWTFPLYINNVVDTETICLPFLWYVAADMQLFWISPLVLYPLFRKPRLGLTILSVFLIISMIIQASVITSRQSPVASFLQTTDMSIVVDAFVNIYMATYSHAVPWFIGMFLGYYMVNHDQKLEKWMVIVGWLFTLFGFSFSYFGLRYFMASDYVYNMTLETTYAIIERPIWALCISWIIYASVKGCAGPISSFLSWRVFLPLSRLSFSMYMVHMVVQLYGYADQRIPLYQSSFNLVKSFLGTVVITCGVAFIFSLLFESPIIVFEKIMFRVKPKSDQNSLKKPEFENNNYDKKKLA